MIDIADKVIKILHKYSKVQDITLLTELESLHMTSFDLLSCLVEIEDSFCIEENINLDELISMITVEDLISLVNRRLDVQ